MITDDDEHDATDELRGALAVVSESLRLGLPCVYAVRTLRDACDRMIDVDEDDTRRRVAEIVDAIFQPATGPDRAD